MYTSRKIFLGLMIVFFSNFLSVEIGQAQYSPQPIFNQANDVVGNPIDKPVQTVNEQIQIIGKPTNQIKIPGLSYTEVTEVEENDGVYLYVPFIGEYLSVVYRYLVVLAGVAALIVIIVAGIQWTASGGNSSTIESAKNRIVGALTGLGLAVGSYIILYTINPDLVNFKSLKIKYIEGKDIAGDHGDVEDLGLSVADFTPAPNQGTAANCPDVAKNVQESINKKAEPGKRAPLYAYVKDAEKCRQDCIKSLPPDKKSQASASNPNTQYLGYNDCASIRGTRALSSIEYIGIHEGKVPSGPSWWWLKGLANPADAFGTHYFITRQGTVYQTTDERFIVWHGVNNTNSIGIDLDGGCSSASGSDAVSKTCNYTDAQYAALKKLITEISDRTNVKFDDQHTKGHCEGSTSASKGHVDPRNFDWTKISLKNEEHRGVRCLYAK